jgi:broad specificity phosphatase PhoE
LSLEYLLLVRHSLPEIRADIPSVQWDLSTVGRLRCEPLARKLKGYSPSVVVTSIEPKAVQTGAIVAQNLGIPALSFTGLHEHERAEVVSGIRGNFETLLANFFAKPKKLIFGRETAEQALERFLHAMKDVFLKYPAGNTVVVTHGTVITLWTTNLVGGDPFTFWKRLGMPSMVVFSRPDLKLIKVIENVE